MRPAFRIEPLGAAHDRSRFDCTDDAINAYLRTGLDRDVGRYGRAAYMATLGDRNVVGFYTLSNAVVEKHRLTRSTRDRVPGYVSVPSTLLGRMGIDRTIAGRGYGTDLVIDALHRALVAARSTTGSSLLVVDAKNDALITFYARLGFTSLPDQPRRLVYPMHKIEKLFGQRG